MTKRSPFIRYKLILERLQTARKPSLKDILSYLDDYGHHIEAREFQRDILALNMEFSIEVRYDRRGNFYYIDGKESPGLENAMLYLEMAQDAGIIIESFRDMNALRNFIIFDHAGLGRGMKHLPLLIGAIKSGQGTSLWHRTFQDEEERHHIFTPRLLKQYQGRWYVIGAVDGIPNPMVFGLDRIEHLDIEPDAPKAAHLDLSGFEDIVGVSLPEGEAVEVRFTATPLQAKYLESLPIHRSQQVIGRRADYVEFTLQVRSNYELKQELLRLGESIQVLGPEALIQELRAIHENYLNFSSTTT